MSDFKHYESLSYIIAFFKWLYELIARPFYYHIAYDSILWETAFSFKGITICYGTVLVIVTLVLAWLLHRNYACVIRTTIYAWVAKLVQLSKQFGPTSQHVRLVWSKIKTFLAKFF